MASRACGNRLSLRNQYDTKTPRASTFFQGFPPAPAQFDCTSRTKLASRKNTQRGFRVDPEKEQSHAENVLRKFPRTWEPKKSPGTPESPPDRSCVKQQESSKPTTCIKGPQAVREDRFQKCIVLNSAAALRMLPWLRISGYRRQFTYGR